MIEDSCIEWDGYLNAKNYGRTHLMLNGKHVFRYVHRLAWEETHGPIPAGMCVLHKCDNPPCFNVDHLFLGSRGDNNRDMWRKGRGNAGAIYKQRDCCAQGHKYPEDVRIDHRGARCCRVCDRLRARRYRAERKSQN